ncbi:aldehyde dehydrogenase family protein [Sphingomonas sp. MS122]|uniref:aldehyde dehydrogenase family protein n=1 Tax=Sphingomonas sp. MS122 TaxID=3412683 RepID=UPI003C2D2C29
MLEAQRAAFFAELPVPPAIRRDRLQRATLMIERNADALCAALVADQANQDAESAMRVEVVPALATLRDAQRNVAGWMRPKGKSALRTWLGLGGDYVEYQPLGVVGIAAPAALPLLRTASVLASALAAGNRVMLRFDDASPQLASLFESLAPDFFDPLELAVVPGESGPGLAGVGFDLLVADASTGKGIALAGSGKSPAILGRSADFARAAACVVADKRAKGGRFSLAPDYLLVPEEQEEAIAAWLWRAAMRPGAEVVPPLSAEEGGRLARLLDDARARGGEVMTAEPRGAGMPLHIVRHASEDMLVMQEEIEGPILPLRNYARIEDAIAAIHRRPPPIAIYYFGRDAAERRHVVERTLSSTIAIDVRSLTKVHKANAGMTFGIGEGEEGFRRFSRARQVHHQPLLGINRPSTREAGDELGGAAPALH